MAISIVPSDVKKRFPEFGALSDDVVTTWINEAVPNVNETQWAGKAASAALFLTAHLLAMFALPGCEPAPGPVMSEREGQVQASYKVADLFAQDDLGSTKYGRYFLTLRKRLFVTRKI